jgi:hypothetical protein
VDRSTAQPEPSQICLFIQDFSERINFVTMAHRLHPAMAAQAHLFSQMRVRIVKIPPASRLEGFDLRPFKLRSGETRNLRSPVADVLVAWGYAERVRRVAGPMKNGDGRRGR